jgi:hypothetical protein
MVDKRQWDRFSPSTSVYPANHHSTNFSIIIITRGWHNEPICGRSAEWNQLDSTPHYTNLINYLLGGTPYWDKFTFTGTKWLGFVYINTG